MKAPPFPPEHGSWALLAAGLIVGAGAAPANDPIVIGLLAFALVAVNMGRAAITAATRRRHVPGAHWWAVNWALILFGTAAALIFEFGGGALLWLAPPAALFVGSQFLLSNLRLGRRLDRTLTGELLAATGLALSAPAAYIACRGASPSVGGLVWALAGIQSAGGVIHVKGMVSSLGARADGLTSLQVGAVVYHAVLAAGLIAVWTFAPGPSARALIVAYAPLIARAWWGARRRSGPPPKFVRVGLFESALALWCASWTTVALRAWSAG